MNKIDLRSFLNHMYGRPLEPSAERSPDGGWTVRVPVPIFVEVKVSERELVLSRTDMRGFLRELTDRIDAAIKSETDKR